MKWLPAPGRVQRCFQIERTAMQAWVLEDVV